jgi:pimeloyl-ACP methyl ester carboxylesterase
MKKITLFFLLLIFQFFQLLAQDKNYSEWYLQREDVNIFVKEFGKGKDTVIVIHGGFGANHDYMIDAVKGLEKKFHFVLYDQRGSLLSPTKKENLTFQKNVDDLYALIKALRLKNVKLFCHSMGTLVGMEFTRQHPELVVNLVLSGAILPKSDSMKTVFSERYEKQVSFLSNRKEVTELIQPFKEKGLDSLKSIQDIEKSKLSHKNLTEYWRINFAAVNIYDIQKYNLLKGGQAYYKQDASVMAETVNWNYDYRSAMNNTKTTIINGAYDFLDFNGEILKTGLKEYPNIQLEIIPYAGHNSWVDNPKLFKKYLSNALRNAGR